jgi:hypothetical protein
MGPRTRRERGLRPGSPSPPSLPRRDKQAYVKALIKRLKRVGEPIKIDFDVSTVSGVLALQKQVIRLLFDRKLDSADARSINDGIRNFLMALKPSELEAKVDELLSQVKDTRETVNRIKRARADEDGSREPSEAEAD